MTTLHLSDDELVLHYYGEMSEEAEARACAHLNDCARCRESLARLQRVMAAVDTAPVPEPDAWFEGRAWARLEPVLSKAEAPRARRLPFAALGQLPWRAISWGAAAALIVVAAFVAGRFYSAQPAVVPVATTAPADGVHERVLLVDLGDHLDRTETALVEFVSAADAPAMTDRTRVEDLVAANRLYRRTAVASGDQAVADVLDELERALIEIAGTSPNASAGDIDAVRRRIDTRGLLFKVRVMRDELQERVKEPVTRQGQDTTL